MLNLPNLHRLAVDVCGCTDRVNLVCVGHAENRRIPQPEERSIILRSCDRAS
jgi:hypothetical protein